jgi:hypothetical protein
MGGRMHFEGKLVFASEPDAESALRTMPSEMMVEAQNFTRRGEELVLDFPCSGPVSVWPATIIGLDELVRQAIGGSLRCRLWYDGDEPCEDTRLAAAAEPPGGPWSSGVAELLRHVHARDLRALEADRAVVDPTHFDELLRSYAGLTTWPKKMALQFLVQDGYDPRLRPIHLDILRAPPSERRDDWYPGAKAIALCFFEASGENFMAYFQGAPDWLEEKVRARLEIESAS